MTALKEEEFFCNYVKAHTTEVKGIPGVEMNRPMVLNTYTGSIGIELEVEATRRNPLPRRGGLEKVSGAKTGTHWLAKEDGSLRGNAMEYVLNQPCLPEEVPGLVDGLFDVFKSNGVELDNSNRCSTHVHVNMNKRTVNHVTSVIALWGVFEEALIEWCGEERKTNHFCLSMKDSQSLIESWDQYLKTGHFRGDRNLKYSAINVNPILNFGSVEIRCGAAPDDADKIIKWATFIQRFVNYACDRYPNPALIAHDLSERGAMEIMRDISPDFLAEIKDLTQRSFEGTCMEGFRRVQSLCLGHPWDRWVELINKEYIANPFGKKKARPERDWIDAAMEAELRPPQPRVRARIPAEDVQPIINNRLDNERRIVFRRGEDGNMIPMFVDEGGLN